MFTVSNPLLGTKIILDEEKIIKEGEYNVDNLYEQIKACAKENNLIEIDKNTYHAKESEHALANLFNFINKIQEISMFTKNIKEWILIDEEEENVDIIEESKRLNEGIW